MTNDKLSTFLKEIGPDKIDIHERTQAKAEKQLEIDCGVTTTIHKRFMQEKTLRSPARPWAGRRLRMHADEPVQIEVQTRDLGLPPPDVVEWSRDVRVG